MRARGEKLGRTTLNNTHDHTVTLLTREQNWEGFCLFISPWWECVSPHPTPHNILTTSLILRQDKPQRHSTQAIVNINEALMKHFWSELKTFYMTMTPGTKRTLIRSWGYNQCSMKFNLRISMMDQNAPIPFNLKLLTLNWASSTWFNFSNAKLN